MTSNTNTETIEETVDRVCSEWEPVLIAQLDNIQDTIDDLIERMRGNDAKPN